MTFYPSSSTQQLCLSPLYHVCSLSQSLSTSACTLTHVSIPMRVSVAPRLSTPTPATSAHHQIWPDPQPARWENVLKKPTLGVLFWSPNMEKRGLWWAEAHTPFPASWDLNNSHHVVSFMGMGHLQSWRRWLLKWHDLRWGLCVVASIYPLFSIPPACHSDQNPLSYLRSYRLWKILGYQEFLVKRQVFKSLWADCCCCCLVSQSCPTLLWPHGL